MSQSLDRTSEWLYHGVWGILVRWFRVPAEPPKLPTIAKEAIQTYRPANGFLSYLKFQFWLLWIVIESGLMVGWLVVLIAVPIVGVLMAPLALPLIILPPLLSYVAIYLRYDTTWYVISDRSLRIRRGIWIIHETTITFENIQNVTVDQGPLQRYFGIADVQVQTAGGGGVHSHEGGAVMGGHHGLIEGIDNASEIRNLIMSRLKRSKAAGLGDESRPATVDRQGGFSREHLAALREIRESLWVLAQDAVRDHNNPN